MIEKEFRVCLLSTERHNQNLSNLDRKMWYQFQKKAVVDKHTPIVIERLLLDSIRNSEALYDICVHPYRREEDENAVLIRLLFEHSNDQLSKLTRDIGTTTADRSGY